MENKKLTKILYKQDESNLIQLNIVDSSSVTPESATDSKKGVILLTDTESELNAQSGKTAISPYALSKTKEELNTKDEELKEEIEKIKNTIESELGVDVDNPSGSSGSGANEEKKGTVKLSDSLKSPELTATNGETATTPKAVSILKTESGLLDNLVTDDKSNLVNAINEVKYRIDSATTSQIILPKITGPSSNVNNNVQFTSSEFEMSLGGSGEHDKTDWLLIEYDTKEEVWSSKDDTVNKTVCPSLYSVLKTQTKYVLKVRYHDSVSNTWSAYGSLVFSTQKVFVKYYDIGTPGTTGFGVGVYEDLEELSTIGLTPMAGCDDINHDNYGNYEHERGIWVFIPAFCYKFEDNEKSPSYFVVKSFKDFDFDESKANEQNYILHQAFIDGGEVKKGFFISKYLISKGIKSVKNGIPISLCTRTSGTGGSVINADVYSVLEGNGAVGFRHDALTLSKVIGEQYNCASVFMFSALGMLSLVHGWNSTNTNVCAWYDAQRITNFPKGCNKNALKDNNDEEILYQNGDAHAPMKPNTGSANNFAKTTHNGQNNGVCDLNGCMNQIATGIIFYNSKLYTINNNAKLTDFTKDNVQTTNSDLYVEAFSTRKKTYNWGNPNANSFYTDMNGINRSLCGVWPNNPTTEGTSEFGNDYFVLSFYGAYYGAVLCCGPFSIDLNKSGIWYKSITASNRDNKGNWNYSDVRSGFRTGVYLS